MLRSLPIPGLFVTGTDTDVGKTVVAGAIANHFFRKGFRPGVCKPVATGCAIGREGLQSDDAEYLASVAHGRHTLDLVCPQRFRDPLAPAIAAEREGKRVDWSVIDSALQYMSRDSDAMIVEGAGGVLVPMDERTFVLDVIRWLGLPVVLVARPALGTINHTLLSVAMLRAAGLDVAGVVINRYPAQRTSLAEETNPAAIERWGGVPVLCVVPDAPVQGPSVPVDIAAAIDTVDWTKFVRLGRPVIAPMGVPRLV
jgi:dethiobiotin synthetase